jgi:MFS family permease
MMACIITLMIPNLEENWRWAYFVGAAPALLVLWIRRSVKEPEQWHQAKAAAKTVGKELGSIAALFASPTLRRNTLAATLLGTAGVGALWGVANFSTDMVRTEMIKGGVPGPQIGRYLSIIFLAQQFGAFIGMYCCAVLAERISRRGSFFIFFTLAWLAILAFFWGIQGSAGAAVTRAMVLAPLLGFGTLGPYAGYTIYLPELFPTRLRSTGCGFCYNAARILAALAPLVLGSLSSRGFAQAASVVSCVLVLGFVGAALGPETRGKPLPQDDDEAAPEPEALALAR